MSSDSVLLVEDEFLIAELLSIMLADMGLKVCGNAATAEEAVVQARRHLAWGATHRESPPGNAASRCLR